ncbi:MAG: hypothetical protein FJZ64_04875, partial [Chlamydiae bacterium]|nr:hypothetical protein [Chlamydiota bacterium]
MHHPPFSWIRKIKEAIPEAFEVPLFGNAAPFDWHHFSTLLAKQFESPQFSLRPLKQEWLTKDEIAKEKPPQSSLFGVLCLPLNSLFYFLLPKADRNKLTAWMIQSKTKGQISEALKEGFCRFLTLE